MKLSEAQRRELIELIHANYSVTILGNGVPLLDCIGLACQISDWLQNIDPQMSFSEAIIGTGDKETDAGIEKAYVHANPEWLTMAIGVVERAARTMPFFSVNDIRKEIYDSPIKTHSQYAMGGVIGAAKKNGWIVAAKNEDGTPRKVMNEVGHLTTIQVWKSLIYKPKHE